MLHVPINGQADVHIPAEEELTKAYAARLLGYDEGSVAEISIKVDDRDRCKVWFVPDPSLPENIRGRGVLAHLFTWHMVIRGDLFIQGLDGRDELKALHYLET